MSDTLLNPKAVRGDNEAPDYAREVTDRMASDYAELTSTVDGLLEEARQVPKEINSDEQMAPVIGLIKRLRDAAKRIQSHHEKEKAPYLRGGEAVDGFFFKLWERCARRAKGGKSGAVDILIDRIDDYQQRKLIAEQQRRERERLEAERIEREARLAAEKAAREAEEARLAAERARKPERIEEKTAAAQQAEVVADDAKVESMIASDKVLDATISAAAKPADMVRTRTDEGMGTMAKEAYAEVDDYDKLDKAKLWPFINREEIDKALRAWARTTAHKVEMDGAKVGHRNKSRVR